MCLSLEEPLCPPAPTAFQGSGLCPAHSRCPTEWPCRLWFFPVCWALAPWKVGPWGAAGGAGSHRQQSPQQGRSGELCWAGQQEATSAGRAEAPAGPCPRRPLALLRAHRPGLGSVPTVQPGVALITFSREPLTRHTDGRLGPAATRPGRGLPGIELGQPPPALHLTRRAAVWPLQPPEDPDGPARLLVSGSSLYF